MFFVYRIGTLQKVLESYCESMNESVTHHLHKMYFQGFETNATASFLVQRYGKVLLKYPIKNLVVGG